MVAALGGGYGLPTERTPLLRFSAQRTGGAPVSRLLDLRTFAPLPDPGTLGASGFFFPSMRPRASCCRASRRRRP
ncbi:MULTISPECIES: hypothetical protein [unclassified Variovorax]|uniref:hypothetical protein n=1 Tax=unclassified Variovorax TaxID=663243 RepID=UPI003F482BB2